MANNPFQNPPEDKVIEEMLSKFTPQPTSRFFIKMSTAPWQNRDQPKLSRFFTRMNANRRLVWGLAALGLVWAIILITIIPSARVAASQIIHLFLPAPSNQLDVQVTLTSPGDLVDFSDPANFQLTVSDVQQLVGFKVKEISLLTIDLTFIGSRYDASYKAVTLLYTASNYKLFLTQRCLGNGKDVFSIGASANVKNVKIGKYNGEFVMGGWKAVSTQPAPDNLLPTRMVDIFAIWDNELPQSTLRWQVGEMVYELRSDGEGSPSQLELINLANELK